ncbi:MAG: DMT family transporter [Rickettsiales bacterium]|nr:DMT family transporter [Pseudomonadota bacterium]MDA0965963.1 DMT family transporter [Pseudomonadota bacterium]MDG4542565.1 DMT family transporter [Rickettsiales bacterium]MDG4545069.1 DMT family transporter [Rickettsiales bacterium]MDG4547192.1 DMT family transporter [Rickettsiales bacterium]
MPAILYFIASCFLFACLSAMGKHMSSTLNPAMVVFLRNAVELIICIPVLFYHFKEIKRLRFSKILWTRGFISQTASTCWFVAISKVSLPSAMAFSFSTPLFTTVAAVIFLKEAISYRRTLALVIGFVGVLIILQPWRSIVDLAPYSWVFATVILWAVANIVIKKLSDSISPMVIIFYMSLVMTIFSIPAALIYLQIPAISDIPLVILLAVNTLVWQWCLIKAYNKSPISVLQPFEFSKLIFTCLIAYFMFGEVLSISGWFGVILIIISSSYVTWREHKLKKKSLKLPLP